MSAEVVSLAAFRSQPEPAASCWCASDFTCPPHRLVDLRARLEDVRSDVEVVRFCDWSTFERVMGDVMDVIDGLTVGLEAPIREES